MPTYKFTEDEAIKECLKCPVLTNKSEWGSDEGTIMTWFVCGLTKNIIPSMKRPSDCPLTEVKEGE